MEYKDKDWLYNEYITNRKTQQNIANECNVNKSCICKWLKRHNIKSPYIKHIKLSQKLIEFLNGEMLGDGGLYSVNNVSANFQYGTKHKEYLEWLLKLLSIYGLEDTGGIHSYNKQNKKNKRISTTYTYQTRRYRELKKLHNMWYLQHHSFCPSCDIVFNDDELISKYCPICNKHLLYKKIVPMNIKLTPVTLRQWYIGDGNLHKYGNYIRLFTKAFPKSGVELLVRELNKLNFKCKRNKNNIIVLSAKSTRSFLNYIGNCPKEITNIYGYKWKL